MVKRGNTVFIMDDEFCYGATGEVCEPIEGHAIFHWMVRVAGVEYPFSEWDLQPIEIIEDEHGTDTIGLESPDDN